LYWTPVPFFHDSGLTVRTSISLLSPVFSELDEKIYSPDMSSSIHRQIEEEPEIAVSRREFLCDSILAGAGMLATFGAPGQSTQIEGQRFPSTIIDSVVSLNGSQPDWLMNQAVQAITQTAKCWSSADLTVVTLSDAVRELPPGPGIVLTTLDSLRTVAPGVEFSNPEVMRVSFLNEQGFACIPVQSNGNLQIFVVGRTVRGVFNGAVYLRDFCIDSREGRLYLESQTVVRTPQMSGRRCTY
jgi:hypothetical protein